MSPPLTAELGAEGKLPLTLMDENEGSARALSQCEIADVVDTQVPHVGRQNGASQCYIDNGHDDLRINCALSDSM